VLDSYVLDNAAAVNCDLVTVGDTWDQVGGWPAASAAQQKWVGAFSLLGRLHGQGDWLVLHYLLCPMWR